MVGHCGGDAAGKQPHFHYMGLPFERRVWALEVSGECLPVPDSLLFVHIINVARHWERPFHGLDCAFTFPVSNTHFALPSMVHETYFVIVGIEIIQKAETRRQTLRQHIIAM